MGKRLNQEREAELQPIRIDTCKKTLEKLGAVITFENKTTLKFQYFEKEITLYPYSGWFCGKGIKSERGFSKLLKYLRLLKQ